MKYKFEEIVNRKNTYSLKWDGGELIKQVGLAERFDEETIPLFIADMDLPVPQPLLDALHKTVENRIFGYSIFPEDYYKAIQHWFKKRYDWEIQKEEIVYSPGTVHALNVAINTLTNAGDGIIIQRPVYAPFTSSIEGNGRVVRNNPLLCDANGYYSIDFEHFETLAKEDKTTMFLLCNPHNPTGRVFKEDDLKKLSDICAQNNVLIVADEIHGDLIRKNQTFTPIAKVVDNADHIITCTAINKTFNVAGLHCTNMIIPNEAIREQFIKAIGMPLPNPFTVSALISVYNDGEDWLEQLKEYLDDTMDYVKSFLEKNLPAVKVSIPEGTYVMWLDFRGLGLTPKEVHDRIYNKANVVLEDGEMFGDEGQGYQRICIPSPRPIIKEALERIASALQGVEDM